MDKTKILIPHTAIQKRISELAKEIAHEYKGKELVLLAVLNGTIPLVAEILHALWKEGLHDAELATVAVSSYKTGTKSTPSPIL